MLVELRPEEISGAARVCEQMVNSDLRSQLFVRIVGEIFSERIGELDFAGLHEPKNGDGGEHFVHRADAKTSVEFIGNFLFAIGQTVGGGEDRLAVLDD